jgi:hypothetical protein
MWCAKVIFLNFESLRKKIEFFLRIFCGSNLFNFLSDDVMCWSSLMMTPNPSSLRWCPEAGGALDEGGAGPTATTLRWQRQERRHQHRVEREREVRRREVG